MFCAFFVTISAELLCFGDTTTHFLTLFCCILQAESNKKYSTYRRRRVWFWFSQPNFNFKDSKQVCLVFWYPFHPEMGNFCFIKLNTIYFQMLWCHCLLIVTERISVSDFCLLLVPIFFYSLSSLMNQDSGFDL